MDRLGHRALVVGQVFAGGGVNLPGDAPVVLAELGLAAGEFDARPVPVRHRTFGIRRVDRHRQFIERRPPFGAGRKRVDRGFKNLFVVQTDPALLIWTRFRVVAGQPGIAELVPDAVRRIE